MKTLPSIHDHSLERYSVDVKKREIVLITRLHGDEAVPRLQTTFSGVEAYRLEREPLGTILFEINEREPLTLLRSEWNIIQQGFKSAGWPGPWAESQDKAALYFQKNRCTGFEITSSIGLEGWIIAKSMTGESISNA